VKPGWTEVALGEVASVFNGKTPAKSEQRERGHPVLKIKDTTAFGDFKGEFQSFVDPEVAERHAERLIRPGDCLMLNAAHNADYVGSKSFFATNAVAGALATGEWLIVRANDCTAAPSYIRYWLASDRTRLQIRNLVRGIHLYPKDVARLRLPLPPLDEQVRIAAILDRADELHAKRRATIAHLDSLTQAIFIDMFGDPVNNPLGWSESTALGDVADVRSGITKGRRTSHATRAVPYLAVSNVKDRRLDLGTVKSIEATEDEIARYRLERDDILLTEGGDPDKLGRGTLWNGELTEAIHQNHIFRARVHTDEVTPLFLSWLLSSARGKRYFSAAAKKTTGIASINLTQLKAFSLLLPPVRLQREFAIRVARIDRHFERVNAAASEEGALCASLQGRAFQGEL